MIKVDKLAVVHKNAEIGDGCVIGPFCTVAENVRIGANSTLRSHVVVGPHNDDDVIVLATIELAHNLGLKVVAEGVQSKKTWERLKVLNCDITQGYYISKPLSAHAFSAWLMNNGWKYKAETA